MPSSIDVQEPMLVAAIAANHYTAQLIDAGGGFSAHLLRPDQTELALRFALTSGREVDKLQGLATRPGATNCPILAEAAAWLDCRVVHRHDTGDRIYYWADVIDGEDLSDGPRLRQRHLLAAADDHQKVALRKNLLDDAQLQRPLRRQWRETLGGES